MRSITRFRTNNQNLFTVIVLLGLGVIAVVSTYLLQVRSQILSTQATSVGPTLILTPPTINAAPGSTFKAILTLDTSGQSIVGVDALLRYNPQLITLLDIALPSTNPFTSYLPSSNSTFNESSVISKANQTGTIQMGSTIYGSTSSKQAYNGVLNPYATFTFAVNSGATGTGKIEVRYDSAGASADSNVIALTQNLEPTDVLISPTSNVAFTIANTTATMTPTPIATLIPTIKPTVVPTIAPTLVPTSVPTTGLQLVTPLTLTSTQVGIGQTISGTVTYKNNTASAISINELIIAGRGPGGTNLNGPYYDFTPKRGPLTIQPGQSLTLTASRLIQSTDPIGTWYAYSTYRDSQGWHDAPSQYNKQFAVTNAPTASSIIKIYAAGTQVDGVYPSMELSINNTVVKRFDNITGNTSTRQFQELIYTHPTRLTSASSIKISYINDANRLYGDRNLMVDKLVLDGVTYETEAVSVYSTGTWDSLTGCQGGYKKSEWLHCNGSFTFAQGTTTATPQPTTTSSYPKTLASTNSKIKLIEVKAPQNGKVFIKVEVDSTVNATQIDWYLNGKWSTQDKTKPFYLGGDTSGVPNGYSLPTGTTQIRTVVYYDNSWQYIDTFTNYTQ